MSEVQSVRQEPQFAAFVGIDWADQKPVWSLQAVGSEERESGELEHTREAVEAWVGQLRSAPRAAKWKLRKINVSESMLSFSLPISLHARRSP